MHRESDTIAAAATPLATGAVGIVRISGPRAAEVLAAGFRAANGLAAEEFEANRLYYGTFDCGAFSDRCMAVIFRAPHSFTGEDSAEIHCHGGTEIVRGVLKKVLGSGARLAGPGEFTRRAFLNGKLDLSACEGVGEMISAASAAEAAAASGLMRGELFRRISAMQERLTDLISWSEVCLDEPEEDVAPMSREEVRARMQEMSEELSGLAEGYATGRKIRDGISAVLCGRTKAGKSSLFNALLGTDRAIVTELAGTTRDAVDAWMEEKGIRIRLVDTAGVRRTEDRVERLGVERSMEEIASADVVIFLTEDGNESEEDEQILRRASGKPVIRVRTKCDGGKVAGEPFCVSAKTGFGLGELRAEILNRGLGGVPSGFVLTNERHYDAIARASALAAEILSALSEAYPDQIAYLLRELWDVLGEITGTTATEAIVDNIFRKFCLGK